MNEKTAFVTGAGGCVGRRLLRVLLQKGWRVTALLMEQEIEGFAFKDDPRVEQVVGNLLALDPETIPRGATVFHLAAMVHMVPKTPEQRESFFRVNRDGTALLAQAARKRDAAGMLSLSTIAVYGPRLQREICSEDTTSEPDSPYGQSKLQGEEEIRRILASDIPWVILRPCVIYGPGDRGNFARLLHSVRHGRLPIAGQGSAKKNTLYVDNLARILEFFGSGIGEFSGSTFNVADPEVLTFKQLGEEIAAAAGIELRILRLPMCLLRPMAWCGDLLGLIARREMPLSSRKLRVLTTDSVVDTSRLSGAIHGRLELKTFRDGLSEYMLETPLKSSGQKDPS